MFLVQQVVPYNCAVLTRVTIKGKDLGKKRIQQSKHQSLGSVVKDSCLRLVHPFLFTFCEELDDRVLKAPQFASPRPSDCETVISLGMNQMPWNNKPTGSIIVSSPCNQHSRLMRQKMKTSACENLLALFKVQKEKQAQTGSDSYSDHVNLIRPKTENEILDEKMLIFLQIQSCNCYSLHPSVQLVSDE